MTTNFIRKAHRCTGERTGKRTAYLYDFKQNAQAHSYFVCAYVSGFILSIKFFNYLLCARSFTCAPVRSYIFHILRSCAYLCAHLCACALLFITHSFIKKEVVV